MCIKDTLRLTIQRLKSFFAAGKHVLYIEVFCIVSLIQSVLYQRFHCIVHVYKKVYNNVERLTINY